MVNDENGLITALSYDGVHPNKEGFILMSNLVDKAIAQTLKSVR